MVGRTNLISQIYKGASRKSDFRQESNNIFGSDVAFCHKKAVMKRVITPNQLDDVNASSSFYFAVGEAIHEVIDGAIKPISVATEISVSAKAHGVPTVGRVDNIIWTGNGLKIVDTKTCGKVPGAIKPGHAEQVWAYSILTGIRSGSILYFSRNVAKFGGELLVTEIDVDLSDEVIENAAHIMGRSFVGAAYNLISSGPPPYKKNKTSCGWCPLKSHCWDGTPVFTDHKMSLWDDKYEKMAREVAQTLVADMPKRYNHLIDRLAKGKGNPLGQKLVVERVLEKIDV